jgi:septum formation topological specificity factor MinE
MKSPKRSKKAKYTSHRRSTKRKSTKRRSRSKVRIPLTTRGGLYGYHIDFSAKKRRSILHSLLRKRKATYSEVVKRLNVLVIYNKNRHPEVAHKIKRDIDYVHKYFQKYSLIFQNKKQGKRRGSKKRSKRGHY